MALFDAHKNLAVSSVATAPSPATSGASLVVAAGEGTRFPAAPFNATVWPAGVQPTPANAEIVRVTAIATDTLTITRAQESSVARTVVVGDQIAATVTLKTLTDIELPTENASPAFPNAQAYGQSFMAGAGAPSPKYGMIQRATRELGVSLDGQLLSGGVVIGGNTVGGPAAMMQNPAFRTDLLLGPYDSFGGIKFCMMGFNDYAGFNALTNGNAQVENALALSYSRLLAARVIKPLKVGASGTGVALGDPDGATAAVTFNGASWSANADTTYDEGLGYAACTTVNDSVDITLDANYRGEAITIIVPVVGGVTKFTGTLSLDPAGANTTLGTLDTVQYQANLVSASIAGSTQCLRIPAGTISSGAHTLRWKATAITAASAATFGGCIIEGSAPIILPTMPKFPTSTALTTQAAWDVARTTAAAANFPTATLVDLATALSPNQANYTTNAPGDTVAEADLTAYWSTTPSGHPNEKGYARCAKLLLEAAKKVTLSSLSMMQMYQAAPRGLAKWMKPNTGWVSSANKGVCENYDRQDAVTTLTLTTAKVYGLGGFTIPAGGVVSGLEVEASTVGTVTGRWVGLCRLSDRQVIAVSVNAASAYPAEPSAQWFAKPYMAQDDIDVYAILGIVASIAPALRSKTVNTNNQSKAPILAGISTTAATTTPPTADPLAVSGTVLGAFSTTIASVPHATLLG